MDNNQTKRSASFCMKMNEISLKETVLLPTKKIDELELKQSYQITGIRLAKTRFGIKAMAVLNNSFLIWLPGRISNKLVEDKVELQACQQAASDGILYITFFEGKHHPCEFKTVEKATNPT